MLTLFCRKHPRGNIKGITSSSLITELGNCIISGERPPTLTKECIDYLRSVDNLDLNVGGHSLDDNMFKTLCKHRRLKLQNDLKVR